MDEVIHLEILGRHGELVARHALRHLPIRIGRAYDNDVILDDPYVAPHHAVVERSQDGELELVDAGSVNGLRRAGARQRFARERADPDVRYRAGHTEFRIRPSTHAVPAERVDRTAGPREPLVACAALLIAAAAVLLYAWSVTSAPTELAELAIAPVLFVVGILVWAGAWGLTGRLLVGERRFAAHLTVAAMMLIGFLVAGSWDYPAFALSAPGLRHVAVPLLGVFFAWGLWRHLALVTRHPGRGIAVAAVAVSAVALGSLALYMHVSAADDLAEMRYLKAIKPPVVRVAQGREAGEFFRDAEQMRAAVDALKTK